MHIAGTDGLVQDIAVAFGLPVVGFVVFSIVTTFTPRSKVDALLQRLSLFFVLLAFLYLISNLLYQDRAVLKALWRENPIFYSLLYSIVSFLVLWGIAVLAYLRLKPELWRRK